MPKTAWKPGNPVMPRLHDLRGLFVALLPTAHFSKSGEVDLYQKLKMQEEMGTKFVGRTEHLGLRECSE